MQSLNSSQIICYRICNTLVTKDLLVRNVPTPLGHLIIRITFGVLVGQLLRSAQSNSSLLQSAPSYPMPCPLGQEHMSTVPLSISIFLHTHCYSLSLFFSQLFFHPYLYSSLHSTVHVYPPFTVHDLDWLDSPTASWLLINILAIAIDYQVLITLIICAPTPS